MTAASQVWFQSDYSVNLLNFLYRSCHRRISAIKLPNASHNQVICFLLLDGFLSYATRMQMSRLQESKKSTKKILRNVKFSLHFRLLVVSFLSPYFESEHL